MNGVLRRLALALLALALGLGASTAVAATIFRDAARDVKGGAGPDLTSLSVSHTATAVTFRLRFAQAPPLGVSAEGWVDMLLVGIDTPPRSLSRTPRGWYGLDYYAGLHGAEQTAVLVRSSVTKPGSTSRVIARVEAAVTGRTLGFTIARTKLGDPDWIELVVAADREGTEREAGGSADEAPARGAFHYDLGG